MVTINQIQFTTDILSGQSVRKPVCHVHKLNCKKSAPMFDEGETYDCYITANDGGRFAVFTMSGIKKTSYHLFDSEAQLHEHFDEVGR